LLDRCCEELMSGNPAALVFPTYKALMLNLPWLRSCFRHGIIRSLNGRALHETGAAAEKSLLAGDRQVFLLTAAYVKYLLKKKMWPKKIGYVVDWWGESRDLPWPPDIKAESFAKVKHSWRWQEAKTPI